MKWKQITHRARSFGRRAADRVPLSWRGALVAAMSTTALKLFGYGALDLVLFVIGIAGLTLVTLSVLLIAGTGFYLRRKMPSGGPATATRRLEAGSPIRTGFRLPALHFLPLVKISWQWLEPRDVDCRQRRRGGEWLEEVRARRRCEATHIRRRVTVQDVFGLARVTWEHEEPAAITILPDKGKLRNMPVVQSISSAEGIPYPTGSPEGDRMEMRRYAPGDSMRHILWKTFARTRQLNVRTPELAVDASRKTVAYLVSGLHDEPAAAAARVALETGALGSHWLFGADGSEHPTDDLDAALAAIARSGSLLDGNEQASARGLRTFLMRAEIGGEAHCIVFAPACTGTWTPQVLEAARSHRGGMSFVLGTDGVAKNGHSRPLWQRLLFTAETRPEVASSEDLADVLRRLGSTGSSAFVVDRVSGRSYGDGQRRLLGARG